MGLEIKPTSKWWYGRFMANGKRPLINLEIEIKGTRPRSLKDEGDLAFEKSRTRALAKLENLQAESKQRKSREETIQKLHEIRTGGERIQSINLDDSFEAWHNLPRKRKLSDRYLKEAKSRFDGFVKFIRSQYPSAKDMVDIQSRMAAAFMNYEERRNITPKTYNNILILLRSAFGKLSKQAGLAENPFEGIPTKEENTVYREPFSVDELSEIHKKSESDDFMRPIIVTAMCSAMRKGDCCLLKESDIDLKNRYINVKTAKTGREVQIPMFPLLYEELKERLSGNSDAFVFPEQAAMYKANPDGITYRIRKVFKEAGFYNSDPDKEMSSGDSHKGDIRKERAVGLRKASIRDFHSFRVSWVTLALTSGVPLELVKKVTGHGTVEIVLKHYFQPGREDFRQALETKMPSLLTSIKKTEKISLHEQVKKIAEKLNSKNWEKIKAELIDLTELKRNNQTDGERPRETGS